MQSSSQLSEQELIKLFPDNQTTIQYYFKHNQQHVFNHIKELQSEGINKFFDSIKDLDLDLMDELYNTLAKNPQEEKHAQDEITRMRNILRTKDISTETEDKMLSAGIDMIAEGKIAILLMSGG
jgi:hypothetical protein